MNIISKNQAEIIVEEKIQKDSHQRFAVIEKYTREYKFGWVFFYNSKQFIDSKNPDDLVPGVGPIVVTREGKFYYLTTSAPPEIAIKNFEQQWVKEQRGP